MVRVHLTLVLLLSAITDLRAEPTPVPLTNEATRIRQTVTAARTQWEAPGVAVAVVREGKVLLVEGFGTREMGREEPITPHTLFPIASCTKSFTSALLAMLVDEGKLAWDDPVRRHVPTFRHPDSNADALVTIRDLITHRSGVGGHDLLWYRAPWNLDETVRRTLQLPLDGSFRDSYHYSSTMFVVAGRAAQVRGGDRWDRLIATRLCEPLGMSDMTFTTDETQHIADRALGHQRNTDGDIAAMPEYIDREPNPSGSIRASAHDLAAWMNFHLAGGVAPDGTRLVSEKNLRETRSPQTIMRLGDAVRNVYPDSHQISYGMGWVVYDHRGLGIAAHGGMIDGFRTQITLVPEKKLGIAVMNNLHRSMLNAAITNTLLDQLLDLPPRDWNRHYLQLETEERKSRELLRKQVIATRDPDQLPSVSLDRFVGDYEHPAYGIVKLTLVDERLHWEWSSFRAGLRHHHGNVFEVDGGFFAGDLFEFRIVGRNVVAIRSIEKQIFTRKR